jgi:peptidyl-prolyl cis-trans isomerase SurA
MHKLIIISMVMSFLTMFSSPARATTVDRVLAIVNNEVITLSDYKKFILQSGSASSSDAVDETLLRKLIDNKIILTEAKKSGVDEIESGVSDFIKEFKKNSNLSDDEFNKRLAEDGMTPNEFGKRVRDNLIVLRFVDSELNSKIFVADNEIEKFYNNNLMLFVEKPERMLVKAIFIKFNTIPTLTEITDLKIKSLRIISEIKRGEPFEKLIALYADEPLKSRDGILGEFEKGALIAELDMPISSLNEGEVSSPVWTKTGVYIFKMVSKMKGTFTPLIQVRDSIHTKLYQQKKEEKYNEWLKSLWEKSSVTIK